jgi:hypothetical protein
MGCASDYNYPRVAAVCDSRSHRLQLSCLRTHMYNSLWRIQTPWPDLTVQYLLLLWVTLHCYRHVPRGTGQRCWCLWLCAVVVTLVAGQLRREQWRLLAHVLLVFDERGCPLTCSWTFIYLLGRNAAQCGAGRIRTNLGSSHILTPCTTDVERKVRTGATPGMLASLKLQCLYHSQSRTDRSVRSFFF